ncbi:MAG TPA: GAP family protein [Solirubrobacterales bacterium]|nr:GAP family protein [Solirubrobacterales bacterium]
MHDVIAIILLALVVMFTPTLLAAVTVMMLLPNPKRLMLGYLLGAYLTSITCGMLAVFSLDGTGSVSTTQSMGPWEDLGLGALALLVAFVLGTDRDAPLQERRQQRKEAKEAAGGAKESWPERMLGRGSARVTFAVGVVLTFPGVSYLVAMDRIAGLDLPAVPTALIVIAFCVVQLTFLEVPLLGYAFAPERTKEAVEGFRAWLASHGRRAAVRVAAVVGALLVLRGVIELLAR